MTYLISVNIFTASCVSCGMIHANRESLNSHTRHYRLAHATITLLSLGFSMTLTLLARATLPIIKTWQSSSCSQTLEMVPLLWTVTLVTGTYIIPSSSLRTSTHRHPSHRNNLTAWNNGDALVQAVAANNSNIVVVVNSVGPLILEAWVDNPNVRAVVWAGLGATETGNALVDVLYGDTNPSGRLPYTIAKSPTDYPAQIATNTAINYTEGYVFPSPANRGAHFLTSPSPSVCLSIIVTSTRRTLSRATSLASVSVTRPSHIPACRSPQLRVNKTRTVR